MEGRTNKLVALYFINNSCVIKEISYYSTTPTPDPKKTKQLAKAIDEVGIDWKRTRYDSIVHSSFVSTFVSYSDTTIINILVVTLKDGSEYELYCEYEFSELPSLLKEINELDKNPSTNKYLEE